MIATIIIFTWLIQSVLAYVLFKKVWLHSFKEWTVGDRNFHLFLSALPIGLFVAALGYITFVDKNKPSSW